MRSGVLALSVVLGVPGGIAAGAAGCSSSGSAERSSLDGSADAIEAEAASTDGAADAGPDIDQDPDVYPADHQPIPQIDYNGGPLLPHVRVVTVTFAGDGNRDALRSFDHFISTSAWWKETAEGYCVPDGGACVGDGTAQAPEGGAWLPDGSTADGGDGHLDVELAYDFPGATVDDTDIQKWLDRHIAAGDFPKPDPQTLYMLFFPRAATVTLQGATSCVQFAGYHNSAPAPDGGAEQVPYAVVPSCDYGSTTIDFQQETLAASHEMAEAATDPQPQTGSAFYLHSNDAWLGALSYGGGECGDMCTYVAEPRYSESGWTVQRIWSNQAAAQSKQPCQPWDDTDRPYFAAALRAPAMSVPGLASAGYVAVARGHSTTAIADVFSEAPLPHDVLLYAGRDKGPGHLPSDIAPPDDLIAIDLSRNQVHNGNAVVVTFSAPAKSLPGDFHVVLRAVLDNTDYNDWPAIVHVE